MTAGTDLHFGVKFTEEEPPFDFAARTPHELRKVGKGLLMAMEHEPLPEEVRQDLIYSMRHMVTELYFSKADEIVHE